MKKGVNMMNIKWIELAQIMGDYTRSEVDRNHMRRVSEHCVFFAELFKLGESITLDLDILMKAALVHDIAKNEYGREHHQEKDHVQAVLRKTCSDVLQDTEIDRISEIVYWHAGEIFCPKHDVLECALLRMADKVDKYEKERDKLLEKREEYIKNVDEIIKKMKNDDLKRKKAADRLEKDLPKNINPAKIALKSCEKHLDIIQQSGVLDGEVYRELDRVVATRLSYIGVA